MLEHSMNAGGRSERWAERIDARWGQATLARRPTTVNTGELKHRRYVTGLIRRLESTHTYVTILGMDNIYGELFRVITYLEKY